jgi:hypothetical protein
MKLIIEDKDIKDIQSVVHDWYGVELTKDQVLHLLKKYNLEGDYYEFGMDTCVREAMGSAIAKEVVGRGWPCYGDGEEVRRKFDETFKANAEAKGYKLAKDAWK